MARRSGDMIDFVVAVPTYGRAQSIETKTLALLSRHGVPADRIFIFVASEAERTLYANELGSAWPHIIVGVPTLWKQRNYITSFFEEGTHVVSLDDDVEDLYRLVGEPLNGGYLEVIHDGGFVDIIRDAWHKMETYGAYMWSLNVSDNPGYMKANRCTLRHGLCNGFIWGCRLRKAHELTLRYGDGHEDVERTLRYIHLDGFVFRYQEFCAKTHCKTNRGGLQKSLSPEERKAEEERSIELLVAEFPHLIEVNQRSKIGVKFLTPMTLLRRYSMMSSSQFQQYAALKKLSSMAGSHCVCRDGLGRFLLCKIELVQQDIGAIGLVLNSGQALLTSTSGFNEALLAGKIFFVLPSTEFCEAMGVLQPVNINKLTKLLSQANTQAAHGDDHTKPSTKGVPVTASSESQFALYLNSMSCCADHDSEDEDEENEGTSLKVVGASSSRSHKTKPPIEQISRCANVLKKKSKKFEDPAWIEQQRGHLIADINEQDSARDESTLDVLREWAAEGGLDVALKEFIVKQGVAPASVINPLFCASRIWAGGWGSQCTHPRLKNEELCKKHRKEVVRQGYLTHGRYGGPIPPKKRLEFEKWQKKLQSKQGHQACNTLSDTADFSVNTLKRMGRGAGESDRAFAYRTGATSSSTKKRPAAANDCDQVSKTSTECKSNEKTADVVGDVQRTIRAKRPASEISVPEAEREHQAVGVPASKNRVEHIVARRISKKGSAVIDNTRRNHFEAGRPNISEDMVLKVLKPLNLGLKAKVGNTYTFGDLLERCKGQASKIAQLTQLTKDTTFFEQVLAKSDIGDVD